MKMLNERQSINIFIVLCWVMSAGIVMAIFLLSISTVFFVILGFFMCGNKVIIPRFNFNKWWDNIKNEIYYWPLLAIFAISFIDSMFSLTNYGVHNIQIKLPMLALAIGFANLPSLDKKQSNLLILGLVLIPFFINIFIVSEFIFNYNERILDIKEGRSMYSPHHHIRHAMHTVCTFGLGLYYLLVNERTKIWWLILSISIFEFIFIHIFAVRTGMIGLYITIAIFLIFLFQKIKSTKIRILIGIGTLSVIAILPMVIPSLNMKIQYMVYDWKQFKLTSGGTYSDSNRLTSQKIGIELIKEKPMIGHRTGNIRNKVKEAYVKYPHRKEMLPHNQYIYWIASFGIPIGVIVIGCYFMTLFFSFQQKSFLLISHIMFMTISMLVECHMESAISIAVFLFFYCISLKIELT